MDRMGIKKYIKNIKVIQKTNIDKIKLEVETNILEKDLENIKIFTSLTKVIQNLPYMSGYCYTQLTDVQQEINGLMDAKRNYKVDPSIIKKLIIKIFANTNKLFHRIPKLRKIYKSR